MWPFNKKEEPKVQGFEVTLSKQVNDNLYLAERAKGRILRLQAQINRRLANGEDTTELYKSLRQYERQLKWSEEELTRSLNR